MILIVDKHFKRAFKRLLKKSPHLQNKIYDTFKLLEIDPFSPSLKSHKLTGKLDGYWSCSVTYDCRIIFYFDLNQNLEESRIFLIDIGSHDEVY